MTRLATVAAISMLALAACSPRVQLKGDLTSASEVPPTRSAAVGNVAATLDPNTNLLTYTVQYAGLSGPATGAHFHGPAAPGATAGVVAPFTKPETSPITGAVSLTNAQRDQVLAGMWYANIHTAANPNGEIRGQLVR